MSRPERTFFRFMEMESHLDKAIGAGTQALNLADQVAWTDQERSRLAAKVGKLQALLDGLEFPR